MARVRGKPCDDVGRAPRCRAHNSGPGEDHNCLNSNVSVTTDKLSYQRGEPILVTIRNDLTSVIYTLPDQTYCFVATVHRLEAGQWA